MSEEQIQDLLDYRARRGRPRGRPGRVHGHDLVADASTAIFTVNAGGPRRRRSPSTPSVSTSPGPPDAPVRARPSRSCRERLRGHRPGRDGQDRRSTRPTATAAILLEGRTGRSRRRRRWPWPDVKPDRLRQPRRPECDAAADPRHDRRRDRGARDPGLRGRFHRLDRWSARRRQVLQAVRSPAAPRRQQLARRLSSRTRRLRA